MTSNSLQLQLNAKVPWPVLCRMQCVRETLANMGSLICWPSGVKKTGQIGNEVLNIGCCCMWVSEQVS